MNRRQLNLRIIGKLGPLAAQLRETRATDAWMMTPLRSAAALAALAALPLAAARSRFFEYAPPAQLPVGVSAAPPLKATVLPQAYADSFGAKCLDGTPPAFYSLVQDPAKQVRKHTQPNHPPARPPATNP